MVICGPHHHSLPQLSACPQDQNQDKLSKIEQEVPCDHPLSHPHQTT